MKPDNTLPVLLPRYDDDLHRFVARHAGRILRYEAVEDLMRELKILGAHNVADGRQRSLTGKGRMLAMKSSYERFRSNGLLPASYEVVYGHAWAPLQRRRPGVAHVPLEQIRRHPV